MTDLDLHPTLLAATAGQTVEGDTLPNGRSVVAYGPAPCHPDCRAVVLAEGDCNECRNTNLIGPYPESMAEQVAPLCAEKVTLSTPDGDLVGWVAACPLCRPDAYPDGFPGLRSPIGTWLIEPH